MRNASHTRSAVVDWRATRVAVEGTHHLCGGAPCYADRFDEVLPFHDPGLAPVRRQGVAWHITPGGAPAYAPRFLRTFGFYEARAAVVAAGGWHHVRVDGTPLYPERYAWCGNFQGERCTVREVGGRYFHLDPAGRPAYARRWRYAGDFRESAAVVQGDDGRSTHVDRDGNPLHDVWFLDLGVFHKGVAPARDRAGWTHVDRCGVPLYERRFAAAEPFYNGQARVERRDGALEVIDEAGRTAMELRAPFRSEFQALSSDLVGFWRTETLAAAVQLQVPDSLPATAEELGAARGLSVEGARRLLHALGEMGVVRLADNGRWEATARGELLRTDHPLSLACAALEYAGPLRERWSALPVALREERWRPPDVFREVAADAERRVSHHRMLRSYALHDYAPLVGRLPIRPGEVVLDAGGGSGALAELIAAHWPDARVVALDLPLVVRQVPRGSRMAAVGADLWEPWPVRADVVVLARVLHDWDDGAAAKILERGRAALRPGGRIVVVEMLRDNDTHYGGLCGLHLLAVTGGRERTFAEFTALFASAGLRADVPGDAPGLCQLLVCHPAGDVAG
ncbi:MAG TPA: methyltransferase [Longimicrobium sp.]|jgi:SAM-dependent methyltransferase